MPLLDGRMKLPSYYIVGECPVKAIATPDGGMDVLAYDWRTGEVVRNMSFVAKIGFGEGDVEVVSAEEFDRRVEELRAQRRSG